MPRDKVYGDTRKKLLNLIIEMFMGIARDEQFDQTMYLVEYKNKFTTLIQTDDNLAVATALHNAGLDINDCATFFVEYNEIKKAKQENITSILTK